MKLGTPDAGGWWYSSTRQEIKRVTGLLQDKLILWCLWNVQVERSYGQLEKDGRSRGDSQMQGLEHKHLDCSTEAGAEHQGKLRHTQFHRATTAENGCRTFAILL